MLTSFSSPLSVEIDEATSSLSSRSVDGWSLSGELRVSGDEKMPSPFGASAIFEVVQVRFLFLNDIRFKKPRVVSKLYGACESGMVLHLDLLFLNR